MLHIFNMYTQLVAKLSVFAGLCSIVPTCCNITSRSAILFLAATLVLPAHSPLSKSAALSLYSDVLCDCLVVVLVACVCGGLLQEPQIVA